MKEIKFRVIHNGEAVVKSLDELLSNPDHRFICSKKDQYLGISDKSGTEVFEGDILELESIRYQVIYSSPHFVAYTKDFDDRLTLIEMRAKDAVVIGNIHQNPELMEALN